MLRNNRNVLFVPGPEGQEGFLLFVRDKTLFAQRFDAARLEVKGERFTVAEDVGGQAGRGLGGFAVSGSSVLAYWSGENAPYATEPRGTRRNHASRHWRPGG